jgi:hypothetical protein
MCGRALRVRHAGELEDSLRLFFLRGEMLLRIQPLVCDYTAPRRRDYPLKPGTPPPARQPESEMAYRVAGIFECGLSAPIGWERSGSTRRGVAMLLTTCPRTLWPRAPPWKKVRAHLIVCAQDFFKIVSDWPIFSAVSVLRAGGHPLVRPRFA